MGRLRFRFDDLSRKGLFKFVRLPVISAEEGIDVLSELLTAELSRFRARIIVIDSITPLVKALGSDIKSRSLLQNFLYNLAFDIKGVVVAIAEIPLLKETIELGDIEFVADGVIFLKHSVEKGLLIRKMEIRKLRGAPVSVAEAPFIIESPGGIRVFMPPRVEYMDKAKTGRHIRLCCSLLEDAIGAIEPGSIILAAFPVTLDVSKMVFKMALNMSLTNNAKTLMISYRYHRAELDDVSRETIGKFNSSHKDRLYDMVKLLPINPAAHSLEGLIAMELSSIAREKPDIVLMHGIEILRGIHGEAKTYEALARNEILMLKRWGVTTIRVLGYLELSNIEDEFYYADITLFVPPPEKAGSREPEVLIWKRGEEPVRIPLRRLAECIIRCA
jgi:circadian clock protein KaiC